MATKRTTKGTNSSYLLFRQRYKYNQVMDRSIDRLIDCSDVTIIESKIIIAIILNNRIEMLSDLMKRLFHLARPSSTAIVGAHVYR